MNEKVFKVRGNGIDINWRDYIVSTADLLRGKHCVKGTRIPVSLILDYLYARYSFEQIIQEFPDLKDEQIVACLHCARDLAEFEVVV